MNHMEDSGRAEQSVSFFSSRPSPFRVTREHADWWDPRSNRPRRWVILSEMARWRDRLRTHSNKNAHAYTCARYWCLYFSLSLSLFISRIRAISRCVWPTRDCVECRHRDRARDRHTMTLPDSTVFPHLSEEGAWQIERSRSLEWARLLPDLIERDR